MTVKAGTTNESTRIKWIEDTLGKIPAGLTILDAGAGECPFKSSCAHLNYISQDFAQYEGTGNVGLQTGKWDNSKIDIVSDITDIPLESNSIDAVLCSEVLEHVPNPVLALEEMVRLLKPQGFLILTAPFASLTHFAPYHFSTGFSRFFYETHLTNNGFEILDMQFNGNYFELLAQEHRRLGKISSKYSGTKLNYLERKVFNLTIRILDKLSRRDTGSSELLCFGIHVFAQKRNSNTN